MTHATPLRLLTAVWWCVIIALIIPVSPAHAQIAAYMVGILDRTVYEGDAARVVWLAPRGRAQSQGWVGIYEAGASDRKPIEWQYIHPSNEYGYLTFRFDEAGDYEVRMFSHDYTRVARASGVVRVRPDSGPGSFSNTYRIAVAEDRVTTSEPLQIEWQLPWDHAKTRHWVGVFERGAEDRDYVTWTYLSPDGDTSGTTELSVSEPGRYELRLFRGSGYERVTESDDAVVVRAADSPSSGIYRLSFDRPQVSTGEPVNVSWTAPGGRGTDDWIGLYLREATDRNYTTWEYVSSGSSGTVSFTAPRAGTYEARFFLDNGYTKVGESSNQLQVR